MKQLFDISSEFSFYLLLGFLFLVNFSIAGCYVLFTLLIIQMIIFTVRWLKRKDETGEPFLQPPQYFKYFLLYILLSFVSTLFAIDRVNSLKDNKEFFVFLLIPLFLIIINSRKRLEYSLYTVLTSAVISSLIGIGTTLKQGLSLDHRLHGLTSHWMTYSGLLTFPFIFFFIYLFYEKRRKVKTIIAASVGIIMVSILLSLTRSMWVGIFVALGIFVIYYKPKILYLAIPVLIVTAVLLPGSVKTRLVSIFDLDNATNKDRIYMAAVSVAMFKDHPLTGVGPNNVKKVYDRYKPPEARQSNPHLHNNFLHVLAERGLPALLSLLAAFIFIIVSVLKKIKTAARSQIPIAVGAFFVFIGFVVAGLFEYNFGDSEIKFLLFYFITIPFTRFSSPGEETAPAPPAPDAAEPGEKP
jgi:O-antigen ligase